MPTSQPLDLRDVLEAECREIFANAPPLDQVTSGGANRHGDARLRALRQWLHQLSERPAALCLSGGGIRSATFCLGVLQGLARHHQLGRFHYLSTVSGGGYVGGWLSSWIAREGLDEVSRKLAAQPMAGADDPEPSPVRYLRSYSSYLAPRRGFSADSWTLIATFLRNLLLHWVVLVPLLVAVLLIPRVNVAGALNNVFAVSVGLPWLPEIRLDVLGSLAVSALAVFGLAFAVRHLPSDVVVRWENRSFVILSFIPLLAAAWLLSWVWAWRTGAEPAAGVAPGPLVCAVWGTCVYLAALIVGQVTRGRTLEADRMGAGEEPPFSPGTVVELAAIVVSGAVGGLVIWAGATYLFPVPHQHVRLYTCLAVPYLLLCFWVATAAYAGIASAWTTEEDREWWARSGAFVLMTATVWAAGHWLVLYGPSTVLGLGGRAASALTATGGIAGLVTVLAGYLGKGGLGNLAKAPVGLKAMTARLGLNAAAVVFIVFLLQAVAFLISVGLDLPGHILARTLAAAAVAYDEAFLVSGWWRLGLLGFLLAVCVGVSVGASWLFGINRFSLHAMYGNRLTRAYLGATRSGRNPNPFTGFDPDDNVSMRSLVPPCSPEVRRLFHVVNIALNLVAGKRLEWQQRKAASFTVSPLHAGSAAVAYQPVGSYGGGDSGISLGKAVAISGAAASPNMGYHSSPAVAFVMAFFNVRLGWWLPNPGAPGSGVWSKGEPRVGLRPLIAETLALSTDERPYVYLSDGGHFDNLGLYEMVRRRCGLIVVVDATCDPRLTYDDLSATLEKIRTDLGISVVFPPGSLPTRPADLASRHFAVGRVEYAAVDGKVADGRLIYIKPVLTGDETLYVAHYASTHADSASPFPHQSTAEQFFDETQFETYRELGLHSLEDVVAALGETLDGKDTLVPISLGYGLEHEDPAGRGGASIPDRASTTAARAASAGASGAAGAADTMSPVGVAGAIGPVGVAGAAGAIGRVGSAGTAGAVGAVGATGAVGLAGAAGIAGAAGTLAYWIAVVVITVFVSLGTAIVIPADPQVGPAGPPGRPGPPGAPGARGRDGQPGRPGDSVVPGASPASIECPKVNGVSTCGSVKIDSSNLPKTIEMHLRDKDREMLERLLAVLTAPLAPGSAIPVRIDAITIAPNQSIGLSGLAIEHLSIMAASLQSIQRALTDPAQRSKIDAIIQRLGAIENEVKAIGPRVNPRGAPGGTVR